MNAITPAFNLMGSINILQLCIARTGGLTRDGSRFVGGQVTVGE